MYKYFISYAHEHGFGNIEITRKNRIESIDDIADLEKIIQEKYIYTNVSILNYKSF